MGLVAARGNEQSARSPINAGAGAVMIRLDRRPRQGSMRAHVMFVVAQNETTVTSSVAGASAGAGVDSRMRETGQGDVITKRSG